MSCHVVEGVEAGSCPTKKGSRIVMPLAFLPPFRTSGGRSAARKVRRKSRTEKIAASQPLFQSITWHIPIARALRLGNQASPG